MKNGEIEQGPDGQRENPEGLPLDEIGAPEGDAQAPSLTPANINGPVVPVFPFAPGGAD